MAFSPKCVISFETNKKSIVFWNPFYTSQTFETPKGGKKKKKKKQIKIAK